MMIRFFNDRRGGTAIEYAMIASLTAILLITSLTSIGLDVEDMFEAVVAGFAAATP